MRDLSLAIYAMVKDDHGFRLFGSVLHDSAPVDHYDVLLLEWQPDGEATTIEEHEYLTLDEATVIADRLAQQYDLACEYIG